MSQLHRGEVPGGEQRILICLKHHGKANGLEFSERGRESAVR